MQTCSLAYCGEWVHWKIYSIFQIQVGLCHPQFVIHGFYSMQIASLCWMTLDETRSA